MRCQAKGLEQQLSILCGNSDSKPPTASANALVPRLVSLENAILQAIKAQDSKQYCPHSLASRFIHEKPLSTQHPPA